MVFWEEDTITAEFWPAQWEERARPQARRGSKGGEDRCRKVQTDPMGGKARSVVWHHSKGGGGALPQITTSMGGKRSDV